MTEQTPTQTKPLGDAMPAQMLTVESFISRWEKSGAAERANYALFLSELCDLLEVPRPEPAQADNSRNAYVFEHPVTFDDGLGQTSTGFIDLYKRSHFILEAKQGSDKTEEPDSELLKTRPKKRKGTAVRGTHGWDDAMLAAKGQAELYAKALPVAEGWPPFLIVVDVGHIIELYADFTRAGKTYVAFPDARSHRLPLKSLAKPEIRDRLRLVWTDPLALDPSRRSAKVTQDVAARLADLARSLERSGHAPEVVAHFLMRCLFTMFAEDVKLLPEDSFKKFLIGRRGKLDTFPAMLSSLWSAMDRGEFSPILEQKLPRFNGQLFSNNEALPLTDAQLELLIDAAGANWREVEPAIFGTLLERALDPLERHKLGAHYTPRDFVERLVLPTVIEPLREEWEVAKAAAVTQAKAGKLDEARKEVENFLGRLRTVTVLDPACGTGNFLYVTLEHLKRLEGEARDVLSGFGGTATFEGLGFTVDPHQLLGIEVNPRAAAIAELVLWIGYLQWHFRTFGDTAPAEPIIRAFRNIECRDAVLVYDRREEVSDDLGQPVTRWDGRTKKPHPATGELVPDEKARVPAYRYINPRKADWPKADFIVGNPPFIGDKTMKEALGPGYVDALRSTYDDVPDSSDFVLYWWDHSATLTRRGEVRRFGFVSTNSIRQTFNRRVLTRHLSAKDPLSIVFAIPDHPWADDEGSADVRIAMTVGQGGDRPGVLYRVVRERGEDLEGLEVAFSEERGKVLADLTIGPDVASARRLRSNAGLSCPGVKLFGQGFLVTKQEAEELGLGRIPALDRHIRPYRITKDLTSKCKNLRVIDLLGLTEEDVRSSFPEVYQRLVERVKSERDHNPRPSYRTRWWVFGEPRIKFRKALEGLSRYVVTPETSKHRFFTFFDKSILAEGSLVVVAHEDPYTLGVLSSRVHVTWALAAGARLGVGNDPRYNKTRCFDPFPFPAATEVQKARIQELGLAIDEHRKRQQEKHPELTFTPMYNVLEKLRAGEPLSDEEKRTNNLGLISALKQLHDDLDAAVLDAYGWPASLGTKDMLFRLVALNAERLAEEARGQVRWLRPEFQNPRGTTQAVQQEIEIEEADEEATEADEAKPKRSAWPKTLSEQVQAVRLALAEKGLPVTAEQLAREFTRARVDRVSELLETLASLGQIRELSDGLFISASPSRRQLNPVPA